MTDAIAPAHQHDHQRLLIVDFGSQVTQLIARRLRELHVYCEIHPFNAVTPAFLAAFAPRAVILSGGPASVADAEAPAPPPEIFALGVPVLGICYGQQIMTRMLGGRVERGGAGAEFGRARVTPCGAPLDLLQGWFDARPDEDVWMSHGDHVAALAPGFAVHATSPGAPFAVIADPARRFYGVQFHPEVHHTPRGATLYENFVRLAGFTGDWTMRAYRAQAIEAIRQTVGDGRVICALSGGVDSSVAALLLHEAVGDALTCVFVDHGLLRAGEAEQVTGMFRKHYNLPLVHATEADLFLDALAGVTDPEVKRKTIGRLFVEVFERHAREIGADFLAQGTLYPDVIESVSFSGGPSVTIKSHHNVGGLPEKMGMRLVEPLRELFKDEVRALGRELGLPDSFVGRHPFPGPGLAIRCPGEVTRERVAILRQADAVFIDQIRRHGLYDEIWQAFVALLPVRTVGVMGDGRTYDNACALRAVTSVDGMTADYYPFTHDFLGETATRIINEVRGINRVTYDITSKPPGTIEWE